MNELAELFRRTDAGPLRAHAMGFCPCHADEREGGRPSLNIDITKKPGDDATKPYIWCRSCGANGLDAAKALGLSWHGLIRSTAKVRFAESKRSKLPLPSRESILDAANALERNLERWTFLTRDRLISPETIKRRLVGWDEKRDRYLFPIFDDVWYAPTPPDDFVLNGCLWYPGSPFDNGTRKMCNWRGHKSTLYPNVNAAPYKGSVLLCEGELDQLCAESHGLISISGTTGARAWNSEWNEHFEGCRVAIAYDCDEAGRQGSEAVAKQLSEVDDVEVVVLDLDPDRSDGFDITDFFRTGGTALELRKKAAAAFKKRRRFV